MRPLGAHETQKVCYKHREKDKSVSGVVPTPSQPVLRINLCWHDTGLLL